LTCLQTIDPPPCAKRGTEKKHPPAHLSQLGILEVVAARLGHRISLLVACDFFRHHIAKLEPKIVGKFEQQNRNISDFRSDLISIALEPGIDVRVDADGEWVGLPAPQ
jgi:hypothetical protein